MNENTIISCRFYLFSFLCILTAVRLKLVIVAIYFFNNTSNFCFDKDGEKKKLFPACLLSYEEKNKEKKEEEADDKPFRKIKERKKKKQEEEEIE